VARRHGLAVIEDCAHAVEARYKGAALGTLGDFGCFSFYATKNVTTGEGGMVLARDAAAISRIRCLALHGMTKDAWKRYSGLGFGQYDVVECGFKYNMMDLQGAVGIHQLQRVEAYWKRRQEIWTRYNEAFADLPISLPAPPEHDTRHAFHLYTILVDEEACGVGRDSFLNAMTANNIGVGVHYLSIPEHPFYQQSYGWKPEQFPAAMKIGRQTVSLPISARLSDGDVSDVISAVRSVLRA
jgi:dTDP-4-amino-4,6-dideoxygalactose transaminase